MGKLEHVSTINFESMAARVNLECSLHVAMC